MARISSALNTEANTRTSSSPPLHEAGLSNDPLPMMNCGQLVNTPFAAIKLSDGWSNWPLMYSFGASPLVHVSATCCHWPGFNALLALDRCATPVVVAKVASTTFVWLPHEADS